MEARAGAASLRGLMRVYEQMTRDVVTVDRDVTLLEVSHLLAERRISGVPVVDAKGRVRGVVSEADVVRLLGGEAFGETTAGDAMSSPAITIDPGRTVAEAAGVMLRHGINRLPVVDDKRLVGIVARADLVRAFIRDDDDIAKDIRGNVLLRGVYVAPREVDVAVSKGDVTLTGEVESKGKAELLVELVRRVPGVVAVDSQLRWRTTDKAPRGLRSSAR
jgi:CBS domain-containing protein